MKSPETATKPRQLLFLLKLAQILLVNAKHLFLIFHVFIQVCNFPLRHKTFYLSEIVRRLRSRLEAHWRHNKWDEAWTHPLWRTSKRSPLCIKPGSIDMRRWKKKQSIIPKLQMYLTTKNTRSNPSNAFKIKTSQSASSKLSLKFFRPVLDSVVLYSTLFKNKNVRMLVFF